MKLISKLLLLVSLLFPSFSFSQQIVGAGSTAAQPLYTKWSVHYPTSNGYKLTYQAVGSAAGVKQIEDHAVDFGTSDFAPSAAELRKNKLICFPIAITGVVPVFNLPGIKAGDLQLTGELLAGIYSHKIRTWNDPALVALNPSLAQVKFAITTIAIRSGSGTTYNFTDYLTKVSSSWRNDFGRNLTMQWPTETVLVNGSAEVVTAVKQTPGAIAYVDYSYVAQEKLSYVKLSNHDGRVVSPKAENFAAAVTGSSWKDGQSYDETLTNMPGLQSWPITMGTFVLIPQVSDQPERTIAALKFFTWIFMKGDALANDTDFVRVPDRVQAHVYGDLTKITDTKGQTLHWNM